MLPYINFLKEEEKDNVDCSNVVNNYDDIVVNTELCEGGPNAIPSAINRCGQWAKGDEALQVDDWMSCNHGKQYLYFVPNSDTTPTSTPSPLGQMPSSSCTLPNGYNSPSLTKIQPACRYSTNAPQPTSSYCSLIS